MAGNVPAPRRQYDPYSNTYNPGWKDHPNFNYGGNRQQNFGQNRLPGFQPQNQPKVYPSSSNRESSLEDLVKNLATITTQFQQSTAQFQQETRSGMKNLKNQVEEAKETREGERDSGGIQKSGDKHSSVGRNQTSTKICKISKRFVHQ